MEKKQQAIMIKTYEEFSIPQDIKDQAYKIEIELFKKYSGKAKGDLYYKDVPFDCYGDNYLHTLMCGVDRKDKETFVFLHGFQGNSLSFYRILPLIYDNFNSFAPDLLGMGLSSRPNITFNSPEEVNEIYIESLEAWRKTLGIEKFYLCGHSMGGYFALIYALKYPQHIKDIILFAPTGVTDVSLGGNLHEYCNWAMKMGFYLVPWLWSPQPRLQNLNNNFITRALLNVALRHRYVISKEESELTGMITELTFKYPQDLDQCVYYIYRHPFPTTNLPVEKDLENKLKDKNFIFLYGENDWMERAGPRRLCQKYPERFQMYQISKFGHTFPLENPEECAEIINTKLIREKKIPK